MTNPSQLVLAAWLGIFYQRGMTTALRLTPTVAAAVDALRNGLERGAWQERLPGERALCQQLGVSRDTVRLALQELARDGLVAISPGRATRVLPNAGKASRDVARPIIGMLVPKLAREESALMLAIIDDLRAWLHRDGYEFAVFSASRYHRWEAFRTLDSLVREQPMRCWVLASANTNTQRWFAQRRIPTLVFGSCDQGVNLPSVDEDYFESCCHAAARLAAAGHRHLALVMSRTGLSGEQRSWEGFQAGLTNRAGQVRPLLVQHDGTREGICQVLDTRFRAADHPTAILVCGAVTTITVITHLAQLGWRVPRDVSVVSRDHDLSLEFCSPPVAHYRRDRVAFLCKAYRALMRLANGRALSSRVIRVTPAFQAGGTIAPPPKTRPDGRAS